MKECTIEAPEGFKIKSVNTVNGKAIISFEEIPKELPTTLEETIPYMSELCYYITGKGDIDLNRHQYENLHPNILTSLEYAEAFIALMQLIRFRDIWNGDWKPNWGDSRTVKYVIVYNSDKILTEKYYNSNCILSFKSPELSDKFLETFRELIIKAKPLL